MAMHENRKKRTFAAKNRRSFLNKLLVMLASCGNYICAFTLLFIWKTEFYYYVIIFTASFFTGAVVVDYVRSMFNVCISLVLGAVIAVWIAVAPPIIYGGDPIQINAGILLYSSWAAKLLLISLPLCIFVALSGCFIGEFVEGRIYLAKRTDSSSST